MNWQMIKQYTWLFFALLFLLVSLVFWGMQIRKPQIEIIEVEQKAQDAARPIQSEKVTVNQNLGGFLSEVPPIDLRKRVVASGNHEPEYRGSRFISEHQQRWTIELMRVSEEDIIRAYLLKRDDRQQFQYFQLQYDDASVQFVLTYGAYRDAKSAMDAIQKIDFSLPDSIKIVPQKISVYAQAVRDLGADELANGLVLRSVVLNKAALPKVADLMPKHLPTTQTDLSAGTTTSVQQRDTSGNIQGATVERSKSVPEPKAALPTTERDKPVAQPAQIVDPF